jgi:hypothetical protein
VAKPGFDSPERTPAGERTRVVKSRVRAPTRIRSGEIHIKKIKRPTVSPTTPSVIHVLKGHLIPKLPQSDIVYGEFLNKMSLQIKISRGNYIDYILRNSLTQLQ